MKRFCLALIVLCVSVSSAFGKAESITSQAQLDAMLAQSKVTLVHFYLKGDAQQKDRAYMSAYDQRTQEFRNLMEMIPGAGYAKVNIARPHLRALGARYQVDSTPTYLLFKQDANRQPQLLGRKTFTANHTSTIQALSALINEHAAKEIAEIHKQMAEDARYRTTRVYGWNYPTYWYPYGAYYHYYPWGRYYGYPGYGYGGLSLGFGRHYYRPYRHHGFRSGFRGGRRGGFRRGGMRRGGFRGGGMRRGGMRGGGMRRGGMRSGGMRGGGMRGGGRRGGGGRRR